MKFIEGNTSLRIELSNTDKYKFTETPYMFITCVDAVGTDIVITSTQDPNNQNLVYPYASVTQPVTANITELKQVLWCMILRNSHKDSDINGDPYILTLPDVDPCFGVISSAACPGILQNVNSVLYFNGSVVGGGNTYTCDNGLTENPLLNFQLGGPLIKNTTVITDDFFMRFIGTNTGTGNDINMNVDAQFGKFQAESTFNQSRIQMDSSLIEITSQTTPVVSSSAISAGMYDSNFPTENYFSVDPSFTDIGHKLLTRIHCVDQGAAGVYSEITQDIVRKINLKSTDSLGVATTSELKVQDTNVSIFTENFLVKSQLLPSEIAMNVNATQIDNRHNNNITHKVTDSVDPFINGQIVIDNTGTGVTSSISSGDSFNTSTVVVSAKSTFIFSGQRHKVAHISVDETLDLDKYVCYVDIAAAPITLTLPGGVGLPVGTTYRIKAGVNLTVLNNLIISGNGNNIDGSATFTYTLPYESHDFTFVGSGEWAIL